MIPGLFDGIFGNSSFGKATEMALEVCIFDEMEQEHKGNGYDWLRDDEGEDSSRY